MKFVVTIWISYNLQIQKRIISAETLQKPHYRIFHLLITFSSNISSKLTFEMPKPLPLGALSFYSMTEFLVRSIMAKYFVFVQNYLLHFVAFFQVFSLTVFHMGRQLKSSRAGHQPSFFIFWLYFSKKVTQECNKASCCIEALIMPLLPKN